MPIVVSHQPSMGLLASAGYEIGAGKSAYEQQQFARQERMQQRSIQASMMQQQMQMAGQQNRMQQQTAMQAAGFQNDRAIADLQNRNRVEMLEMQQRMNRDNDEFRNQSILERDQAQFMNSRLDGKMDEISELEMAGYQYEDPSAKQKWFQEMDRINNDRTLTPLQKSQARFQMADKLPIPTVQSQSIADQMKNETHIWQDKFGQDWMTTRGRSGNLEHERIEPPEDQTKTLKDRFKTDDKAFTSVIQMAVKAQIDLHKAQLDVHKAKVTAYQSAVSANEKVDLDNQVNADEEGYKAKAKVTVPPEPAVPELKLDFKSVMDQVRILMNEVENMDLEESGAPVDWELDEIVQ